MGKGSDNFKIKVGEGFPVEKALRKFKRMCDAYGIVRTYREKESYSKPSEKAKLKREAAEKRRRKTANRSSKFGGTKI